MSKSHPRPGSERAARRGAPGNRIAGAGALVVAALLVTPWLAGRYSSWPPAPAVASFFALAVSLYVWFRMAQQTSQRTAIGLSLVYAAIGAGVLYLWLG